MNQNKEIEIKMIVNSDDVDFQKYPEKQTVTGVVFAYANKGQFEIQSQCEEALANIWHLLNDDAKDEVREIAPDFCKERRYDN